MKTLGKTLVKVVMVAAVAFAFAGCADNGGLAGMGQVARNSCRMPVPVVYTKGDLRRYSK